MGLFNAVLDNLAQMLGLKVQGHEQTSAYRDSGRKGETYSVESMVCESLANLTAFDFAMPIEGGTPRASLLDGVSDDFVRDSLTNAIAMGFLVGDCVTVPSWNGHGMDNVLVPSGQFAILGANGREITKLIYVVDEKQMRNGPRYTLLRLIELTPYTAADGTQAKACRYKTYIAQDGVIDFNLPLEKFPDWAASNEDEWIVPNVDRLLIARFRSFALDPLHPNAQKGTPICFGASAPIREIHYLTEQMHAEFGLSEKAIIADKTMFKKRYRRDDDGNIVGSILELPKGRERLFMDVRGTSDGKSPITEWAPTIQLQPYVDALEKQYQEVEKCVGVSSGILSNLNDQSYQNVDNVRKATIKTQSFITTARKVAESYLQDMVYAWDTLANFYRLTPVGDFQVEYKWSDEYINTFTDMQNAILAGSGIDAFDAVDYRMFVAGETPEVARDAVERIRAEKSGTVPALTEIEPIAPTPTEQATE